MKFIASSLLLTAVAVHAANQIVMVAPNGGFVYQPNNVTAAMGDTIEFWFDSNVRLSHLHSLTNRTTQ
jgi:plastocyanin